MNSRSNSSMMSGMDANALWMSQSGSEGESSELSHLLTRAASGDAAAFEQIVARHERRVLTLSWRLLGAMEDAQDAAQEVFLRTFKYLHRFDTSRPFEPWLIRLTINVCRDVGRSRRRRSSIIADGEDAIEKAETKNFGSNPHKELQSEQCRQMLYRAIETLPERERTAFVLRDIDGMSTAEAAAALGTSEATIRSQISSARLKIRKLVERMEGGRL
jgi:RNA polymerase sigma-70 factor (ECF subfamily)